MAADHEDVLKQKSLLDSGGSQFLTFSLSEECYGVDILKVQEIKGYVPTTRLPNSPPAIRGVLDLRGTVVPIVDLRRKFNLEEVQYDQFTAIVVVVVNGGVMGMIVDSVSEVITIPPGAIQPAPDFGPGTHCEIFSGMARVEDRLIILLNIEAVLTGEIPAPVIADAA